MKRAFVPLVLCLAACRAADPVPSEPAPRPEPAAPAAEEEAAGEGTSIVVCGERFDIGTRVVLWDEPPYFDAYSTEPRFDPDAEQGEGLRYRPGRDGAPEDPTLEEVQGVVDQFVLHYDVCGSSERCFRVLQDLRGLSVHFLLDVDGTIYQTLDAREQAWHATKSNRRCVGVEIAQMGAWPPNDAQTLWDWYGVEPGAASATVGDAEVAFVEGVVQGQRLVQAEFTPAQMDALVKLSAGLCRALPLIRPDAPRTPGGTVSDVAMSDADWAAFQGILGHYHVQTNKTDPGPAFPWEDYLAGVRRELAR